MFFPSSGGLINISGNLSIAGGPGMTLCANNMLSLLGKQVYSIQLIDYSQDTCYPAMKNRKRTMRLKVGCRISTWQNSKPGKIRQKTHLLYIAGDFCHINSDTGCWFLYRTFFNSLLKELGPLNMQGLGCSTVKIYLCLLLQNGDIPFHLPNYKGVFH